MDSISKETNGALKEIKRIFQEINWIFKEITGSLEDIDGILQEISKVNGVTQINQKGPCSGKSPKSTTEPNGSLTERHFRAAVQFPKLFAAVLPGESLAKTMESLRESTESLRKSTKPLGKSKES